MTDENASPVDSQTTAEFRAPGEPSPRGRLPGKWVVGAVLACSALIVLAWLTGLRVGRSRADLNVATLVLSVVASGTLLVWFLRFSGYSARTRQTAGWTFVIATLLLAVTYRIEHFTGDLIPRLTLRWQAASDRSLDQPVAVRGTVDLATVTANDFPQFLGPRRDNDLPRLTLETDWQIHPPRRLWQIEIGAGWSGFSVVNGFAVTMEQRGDEELVTCLDVATGQVRWFHAVQARHESILGGVGPRSTPTIHLGKVYALGATGVLRCLDGATGEEIWRDEILTRFGLTTRDDTKEIAWGRAASPLIVDDLVVVPWGGPSGRSVSLAAYHKDTGRLVWTGGEHQASYSSPTLAQIAGQRQILIVSQDFVAGHNPLTGAVLWEYPWPGNSASNASVSQPVPLAEDRLLLSKGYGIGAKLLMISRSAEGTWVAQEVWSNSRSLQTKFTNVVIRDGFAYGLSDGILECVNLASGKRQWKGGRYGQGQVLGVGECLLVQAESGAVMLVAARPDRAEQLAVHPSLEGKTWNNPSLFGRFLLVRNAELAACYELVLRNPG